jgi:mono/diheme cytochrome c family protein
MKLSRLSMLLSTVPVALIISCSTTSTKISRWYTPAQVSVGKPLYATHCAGCHGENGEGAPNSDTPLPDGSYPPQPLNGTGHSWHHSLTNLRETIEMGGRHPGATMPRFAEVLNPDERKAVIAAFQNFWNNRIYNGWLSRGGLD